MAAQRAKRSETPLRGVFRDATPDDRGHFYTVLEIHRAALFGALSDRISSALEVVC